MSESSSIPDTPKVLPFIPRMLSADLAALYMGVSRSKFLARVDQHTYPAPTRDGGNTLWDLRLLDRYLDKRSGLA
ncbi:hypothetical protein [Sphingomonas melonis]|uniref:hypothetical protein n=1 Tax=Sphingomonas melonis TaxID=152682 RepID=UPI0035C86663